MWIHHSRHDNDILAWHIVPYIHYMYILSPYFRYDASYLYNYIHCYLHKGNFRTIIQPCILSYILTVNPDIEIPLDHRTVVGQSYLQWEIIYWWQHIYIKITSRGPFYWHGLTLIPAWISNHMPCKVSDEIICPFPNFNGCTVEVWEWVSNFTHTL